MYVCSIVLTWKLEPLGQLARDRSVRFSSIGVCGWVLLVLCGFAGVSRWLWRRQRVCGGHRAGGRCLGLEYAAEVAEVLKRDKKKWLKSLKQEEKSQICQPCQTGNR